MPFGGSSCTSLAQRQSDAIRLVATVDLELKVPQGSGSGSKQSAPEGVHHIRRVHSKLLPMLDDFLGVLPRHEEETDEAILMRAQKDAERFDTLLHTLGLPKAPEKDQAPAFTTVWLGIEFFSKERCIGVPAEKWQKLRRFMQDKLLSTENRIEVRTTLDAADLLSALGKFHHFTLVWTAGRPSLYALWLLLFTASFSDKARLQLAPKKQRLKTTPEAAETLLFWWKAVTTYPAPRRLVLPCNRKYSVITLDIFLIKELPKTEHPGRAGVNSGELTPRRTPSLSPRRLYTICRD